MRLRIFEAPTMQEALARMRATLGPDAVIVATSEESGAVRLTAATDTEEPDLDELLARPAASPSHEVVRAALRYHGLDEARTAALLAAAPKVGALDPAVLLAEILARRYRFPPDGAPASASLLVVGPPGAGKTAVIARLAAAARLAGETPEIASADLERAGGLDQLRTLLAPLGLAPRPLGEAPPSLGPRRPLLIDGPGVNPFRRDEMVALSALVRRVSCEPVLVLPAGLDPEDCAELVANFQVLGVRRMITTRLDAARRLGGILAAAELGLELTLAATSPLIGKPLLPWSAAGLARLVLARAGGRPGDGP
jgi:flagellar biosynthesis protein FlhF